MLKKVTVSVLITCCNLHKYIDDCMESITAQTLPPTEVLILHDSCTSPPGFANTTTICRPLNQGVAVSRNELVSLSKGEYLLFVDADDVLAENYIEVMVKTATETNADIVYPDCLLWSRWGESQFPNKWHEATPTLTHEAMYSLNEVVVTSLMKRAVFEAVGGFETLPLFEDWLFNLQAVSLGYKFVKAHTFLKYRQRMESRNRAPDELRNQVWNEIKDRFELKKGVLHEKLRA